MSYTEANVLADTLQKTRDLTRWYLSLLKNADPYHQPEVNGVKLNSVAWLAAHILWAEDFLVLRGTGGEGTDIAWLDHYKISTDGTLHVAQPDMKELLDSLKLVHEKATAHLLTLSDEKLNEPNAFGFSFSGVSTNKVLVQHCIRHEAMHTGHLSWMCKLNSVKAV